MSQEKLLRPSQVAPLFGVDPKTVTRWIKEGRMTSVKTLGGHHRLHPQEVELLLKLNYAGEVLEIRLDHLRMLIEFEEKHTIKALGRQP